MYRYPITAACVYRTSTLRQLTPVFAIVSYRRVLTTLQAGVHPNIDFTTSTSAPVGEAFDFNITMVLPTDVDDTYTLRVLVPRDDAIGYLSLCRMVVIHRGVALPCFTDKTLTYNRLPPQQMLYAEAVWDLGLLKHVGQRPTGLYPTANVLQFQVIGFVDDNKLNIPTKNVTIKTYLKSSKSELPMAFTVQLAQPVTRGIPVGRGHCY